MSKLIQADYKNVDIATNSVDLIICDPPYGETQNEWDKTNQKMVDELFQFFNRVKKDASAIIMFGQKQFAAHLKLRNQFRYDLIWEKDRPTGFLNANRMPLRNHEEILLFYDELPTYNPQKWRGEENHSKGNKEWGKIDESNNNYGDFKLQQTPLGTDKKHPRSVLKFSKPHPPIHPTQKPVDLYEWLIKSFSNQGDLILDPMSGSGTAVVAAINTGRDYICIERDPEYFDIAKEREQEALKQVAIEKEKQAQFNKFFG